MTIAYRTKATATGGRDGRAATDDRKLEVKLTTPKELGGPGGDATNPEQLFAAGYSACFLSASTWRRRARPRSPMTVRSPRRSASARAMTARASVWMSRWR
jgi:Ohr subfamily peroxiredoxin